MARVLLAVAITAAAHALRIGGPCPAGEALDPRLEILRDSSSPTMLPRSSKDHLARRGYVVDISVEATRIVADAVRALPTEARDNFPSVMVVGSSDETRLRKSDPQTQAFVIPGDNDHVYVTRWGGAFRAAADGHRVELAGALAHEAWHLQNGPDEAGAYDCQIRVLQEMHAPSTLIDQVRRARENAVHTQEFERRRLRR